MLATEWKLEDALVVERMEGLEEGLEKGRDECRRETAEALKELGASIEMITKSTKLSPEVVAVL
jgi:predicted transposase YdaD